MVVVGKTWQDSHGKYTAQAYNDRAQYGGDELDAHVLEEPVGREVPFVGRLLQGVQLLVLELELLRVIRVVFDLVGALADGPMDLSVGHANEPDDRKGHNQMDKGLHLQV